MSIFSKLLRSPLAKRAATDYLKERIDGDHRATRDRALRLLSEARNCVSNKSSEPVILDKLETAMLLVEKL